MHFSVTIFSDNLFFNDLKKVFSTLENKEESASLKDTVCKQYLSKPKEMNVVYSNKLAGEDFYVGQFATETNEKIIIAIIYNQKLYTEDNSLKNLFNNVVFFYSARSYDKLEEMANNPLKYIGRDLYKEKLMDQKIDKTQNQLDQIKKIMETNIKMVINRGEKIDDLVIKAKDLEESAKIFDTRATKLNSCCR